MITKKTFISLFLLLSFFLSLSAQITDKENNLKTLATDTISGWKTGGLSALNFSQTALKNWAAGGENSLAFNSIVSLYANYKSPKAVWENSLDLGYGLLKQSSKGLRKTDDKIELTSKYGRKAFSDFYYAALINFRTQFFNGYNYGDAGNTKISSFLAPAYLLGAVGLNYKPNNYFSAFISPLTGKLTIVADDSLSTKGAFGVDPGKHTKQELGGYARFTFAKNDFKPEVLKNISIATKIDLFSNYLSHPERIDVNWETLIAMKVNKHITVSLNTNLIYDYDTKIDGKDRVQFKEIFGLGASYTFKN